MLFGILRFYFLCNDADSWIIIRLYALGIEAASFASGASKDIAESPMAEPERPKKSLWVYEFFSVMS